MKKKLLLMGLILVTITLVGCTYKYVNPDRVKFKEDYESLNGETNNSGKEYRVLGVPTEHPYTYTTVDDLNKMIENKESFIAYFGANWCPWCRSMLLTSINKANEHNIEKIYYVDVRPGNIINNDIRDIYSKDENGKIYLSHRGTDAYKKFTNSLKDILKDYKAGDITLEGTEFEGEKRIGAPTFIMVKNGKGVTITSGVSQEQTDAYMDLNYEIYKDMGKKIDEFFSLYK